MERWHFDLDQIRKNWERDSAPARTAEKIPTPATGSALPTVCPDCGAELTGHGPSHEKSAPPIAGAAFPGGTAEKSAPPIAGAALPEATAEKTAPVTGSALPKLSEAPRGAMPSRFARVEAPRDPYPEAQALLVRVRALVHRRLAAHEPVLAPFLDEAAEILQRLAAKPGEGEVPVDKKKLRANLDRALGDLEDMAALWSGIGR